MQVIKLGRIDPAKMTRQQELALALYLQEHTEKGFLAKLQDYSVVQPKGDGEVDVLYEFTLVQNIVRRQRKPGKAGVRFEIYNDNKKYLLGKNIHTGSKTMSSLGVLIPTADNRLLFKAKQRAIGIRPHNRAYPTQMACIKYTLSQRTQHMHAKPPTITDVEYLSGHETVSFSVMRKLPGCSLQELINDERQNCIELTFNQRLDLTISILIALKEQVHNRKLIHRDLKPDNIIIDLKTGKAFIVDFELCKISNHADHRPTIGGTLFFQPIEQFRDNSTHDNSVEYSEKLDSYAIGKTLAEFWRVDMPGGSNLVECESLAAKDTLLDFNQSKLDDKLIPDNAALTIKTLLQKLTVADQHQRASINDAIETLENARLELLLLQHRDYPAQQESLKQACIDAHAFRKAWQHSSKTAAWLPFLINRHLSNATNPHPAAVELFIKMIDIRLLHGCKNRDEAISAIATEQNKREKYILYGEKLLKLYRAYHPKQTSGTRAAAAMSLQSLIGKAKGFFGDADSLHELNEKLSKAMFYFQPFAKVTRNMEEMLQELTKDSYSNEEKSISGLRLLVKHTILTYFEEIELTRHSNPPIKPITRILQIANKATCANQLAQDLKNLTQPSTNFSLLFRACRTLHQQVIATVTEYQERHPLMPASFRK
jgi:serine/threonine protein kinase